MPRNNDQNGLICWGWTKIVKFAQEFFIHTFSTNSPLLKKFPVEQNVINTIENSCWKIVKGQKIWHESWMLKCHTKGEKQIPKTPCKNPLWIDTFLATTAMYCLLLMFIAKNMRSTNIRIIFTFPRIVCYERTHITPIKLKTQLLLVFLLFILQ